MRSWQKAALIVACCAGVGLIIWSHVASATAGSAFQLLHLPDRLHAQTQADQDRAVAADTVHVAFAERQGPVMLFDDNAKLAIDAQRRRDKVAQAEKEQAKVKHENLEWERHHCLDDSVYQPVKGQP